MNMFAVHTKNGLHMYQCVPLKPEERAEPVKEGAPEEETPEVINNFRAECLWTQNRPAKHCVCSHNNIAVVDDRTGLSIVHMNTGQTEVAIDTLRGVGKFKNMYTPMGCKNIKHLQWSKNGTYLVIYFNLTNCSDSGVPLEDNLHIWDITKKNIIGTFSTRRLSPEQWPVVRWLGTSNAFALVHNQQVSLHAIVAEGAALKAVRHMLTVPVPAVFAAELFRAPGREDAERELIRMAAFSQPDPPRAPACLRISTLERTGDAIAETAHTLHELNFTDSAEMLWAPSGDYLMVLAQSTVDQAGEKYGATTNCLLFAADGQFLSKANTATTHDARWAPNRDEFVLLQGNMPCRISLLNADLQTLFEFPQMYRNTVKWNPLGNMVALGGFGNLAGEICFWYRPPEAAEMEHIVQFKEPCTVVAEWSPDSRYFITASTFPRMKVDNFFKVFNTEGHLIASEGLDECYHVAWCSGEPDEAEFTRPKPRKSLARKAVYRPKLATASKPARQPANAHFSKAPGSPLFSMLRNGVDQEAAASNGAALPPEAGLQADAKKPGPSEPWNGADPIAELQRNFNEVFSLSFLKGRQNAGVCQHRQVNARPDQMARPPEQVDFRPPPGVPAEHAHYARPEAYAHEAQRNHVRNAAPEDRPHAAEDPMAGFDNGLHHPAQAARQPEPENAGQGPFEELFRTYQENMRAAAAEEARRAAQGDPKNMSMFLKLKNQLQQEKLRNAAQTGLEDGHLLRMLLEAKGRDKPD